MVLSETLYTRQRYCYDEVFQKGVEERALGRKLLALGLEAAYVDAINAQLNYCEYL
jgi:hypothetical protein